MNAEGYILKPVKLPEIRSVFRQAVAKLTEEREQQLDLEQLKQQLQDSMPLLRRNSCRI